MKVILNEKKYVEDCLKYGRINNKPGRTLALMAQYYYDFGGYRKKKIAELLVDFMRKYYRGFDRNEKDYIKMCEGIANRTGGIQPQKHYGKSVIDSVLRDQCDYCAADDSTIYRWKHKK